MANKQKQSRIRLATGWLAGLPLRTKLAVGGVVIFLAFVGLLIDLVVATNPSNANYADTSKKPVDANAQALQREGAIRDSAEQAVQSGHVDQADTIYKNAIDSEQNVEHKLQLYKDRSEVLYDAGQYQEAIAVAREGESVSDDKYIVSDWLSRIYEDQKQYALSAQYYTVAAQWAKSPMNKTGLNKSYYDDQAARVTALIGH